MASPSHVSHALVSGGTAYTYPALNEGDLLIALVFQTSSAVRDYVISHANGTVIWNNPQAATQSGRIVEIMWHIVTATDATNGVTAILSEAGGASIAGTTIYCRATGSGIAYVSSDRFETNAGDGSIHCAAAAGLNIPSDAIVYSVGVLNATGSCTKHPDYTLIETNNSNYLTQYIQTEATTRAGDRATWSAGSSRYGPGAMAYFTASGSSPTRHQRGLIIGGNMSKYGIITGGIL